MAALRPSRGLLSMGPVTVISARQITRPLRSKVPVQQLQHLRTCDSKSHPDIQGRIARPEAERPPTSAVRPHSDRSVRLRRSLSDLDDLSYGSYEHAVGEQGVAVERIDFMLQ